MLPAAGERRIGRCNPQTIRQSTNNCKAGRAHQISYTSVCTPVVGAGGRPRSLLPCAKFTGPRLVTSCNTPTVGSRAGRETTQIRGPVGRFDRGASFSRRRVSRLTQLNRRAAGEEDCSPERQPRPGVEKDPANPRKRRATWEETKLALGTRLKEGGGSVTPEGITGRYVSLERYVPGKDRRR